MKWIDVNGDSGHVQKSKNIMPYNDLHGLNNINITQLRIDNELNGQTNVSLKEGLEYQLYGHFYDHLNNWNKEMLKKKDVDTV